MKLEKVNSFNGDTDDERKRGTYDVTFTTFTGACPISTFESHQGDVIRAEPKRFTFVSPMVPNTEIVQKVYRYVTLHTFYVEFLGKLLIQWITMEKMAVRRSKYDAEGFTQTPCCAVPFKLRNFVKNHLNPRIGDSSFTYKGMKPRCKNRLRFL